MIVEEVVGSFLSETCGCGTENGYVYQREVEG
jgi:hypothetical protein